MILYNPLTESGNPEPGIQFPDWGDGFLASGMGPEEDDRSGQRPTLLSPVSRSSHRTMSQYLIKWGMASLQFILKNRGQPTAAISRE